MTKCEARNAISTIIKNRYFVILENKIIESEVVVTTSAKHLKKIKGVYTVGPGGG